MKFRYFTHKTKEFCTTWRFGLFPENDENFATIQWWDMNGENKCCPFYVDFDYASAHFATKHLAYEIERLLGVFPDVFFSGNKGFHVVLPMAISGNNCEKIVSYIVHNKLGAGLFLDNHMYKNREMWRMENSRHEKTGLYKIKLTKAELFELNEYKIGSLAAVHRESTPCNMDKFNKELFKTWVDAARENLKSTPVREREPVPEWNGSLPPCVYRVIATRPDEGQWHNVIFNLTRCFEQAGATQEETINILLEQEHFQEDADYVEKTIRNTYKSNGRKTWGCKNLPMFTEKCVPSLCKYWRNNE